MTDLMKRLFHKNPDRQNLRRIMRTLRAIVEQANSPKEALAVIAEAKEYKMSLPLYLVFQLLERTINRIGLNTDVEEIITSLEKVIDKNESVKSEHLSTTIGRLGTVFQNRDMWDICASPGHQALFINAGFTIKENNESRWKKSGEARRWVEEHDYSWNHQDWLLLLEDLRKSAFWPMDSNKVGMILENIKQEKFSGPKEATKATPTPKPAESPEPMPRPLRTADLISAARGGNTETVKMLLAKGQDANTKDSQGYPILILAAMNGYSETVSALLDEGADIHAKGNHDSTALTLSAMGGHDETVKLLIDRGADINAKDDMGWPALIIATLQGRSKTVRLLLENGADIDAKDCKNNTAIYYASRDRRDEIYKLLRDRGADTSYFD
jgi:hypothetical protein